MRIIQVLGFGVSCIMGFTVSSQAAEYSHIPWPHSRQVKLMHNQYCHQWLDWDIPRKWNHWSEFYRCVQDVNNIFICIKSWPVSMHEFICVIFSISYKCVHSWVLLCCWGYIIIIVCCKWLSNNISHTIYSKNFMHGCRIMVCCALLWLDTDQKFNGAKHQWLLLLRKLTHN